MNADDLPRLPEAHLQRPERRLKDLKPGERANLITMLAVRVDEESRAWIDGNSTVATGASVTGMTLQAERTEEGFIIWLDKNVTFSPQPFYRQERWIPVIEFREAEEGRK